MFLFVQELLDRDPLFAMETICSNVWLSHVWSNMCTNTHVGVRKILVYYTLRNVYEFVQQEKETNREHEVRVIRGRGNTKYIQRYHNTSVGFVLFLGVHCFPHGETIKILFPRSYFWAFAYSLTKIPLPISKRLRLNDFKYLNSGRYVA